MFLDDQLLEENPLEKERRSREKAGLPVIDLASSNFTRHGYLFPPEILRRAAEPYWGKREYQPDPFGYLPARQAVANYYEMRGAAALSSESVYITASTSESYGLIFSLLAEAGDNFLVPELSYPLFELLAEAHKVVLKPYPLLESTRWMIDEDALLEAIDKRTRGVFFVSPHNPTGRTEYAPLECLSASCRLPLICDEVFAEFTDGPPAPPLGLLYPDCPVFHLNGISKMFALPDLKLGWIAVNETARENYGERLAILNDCYLGANSLVQSMLPAIFEEGFSFCHDMTNSIRSKVSYICSELMKMPSAKVVRPMGGAYVFVRVETEEDEEDIALRLMKAGVLVHPGYFYGSSKGAHLMISCVPDMAKLREGISIIAHEICR